MILFEGILTKVLQLLSNAIIGRELKKLDKDPTFRELQKDLRAKTEDYKQYIRKFCRQFPDNNLCKQKYNEPFLKDLDKED